MRAESLLLRQRAQVSKGLFLSGETAAPAPRRGRERVQIGRYTAGGPGVGVVPPGSAEVVAAVDQHEVLNAGPLESCGHADPAEPGTDHHHAIRRMPGHRPSSALRVEPLRSLGAGTAKNPPISMIPIRYRFPVLRQADLGEPGSYPDPSLPRGHVRLRQNRLNGLRLLTRLARRQPPWTLAAHS